jgi:3-phenylpropionate/trans-cinnamate dioxygenase ferredoxin reductase subunit
MTARVVIVGAGHAGVRFCEEMRGLGFDGALTLIGEEACRPYERPPLSKAVLCAEADPEDHALLPEQQERALNMTFRKGCRASAIDRTARQLHLADGNAIGFDYLVLATGVTPRRLTCEGSGLAGVFYLNDAASAMRVRSELSRPGRSVVVIGGGFIGLEVAAAARQCGHSVTVVESMERVAGRLFPPSLSRVLKELHEARGVSIRAACSIAALVGEDHVCAVMLASGEVLAADLVIIGIGSLPRTDLAAECGLSVGDGILVDQDGRTDDSSIFAIGDVAAVRSGDGRHVQRRESWDNAQVTACRAAAAIMGAPPPAAAPPWFWTDQYDCNVQYIGEPATGCDEAVIEQDGGHVHLYADGGRVAAVALINAGRNRRRMLKAVAEHAPLSDIIAALGGQTVRLAR